MNGRNESFLVSIFRKATGKKVDEIVPFAEGKKGGGGRGGGKRDTAVCDFIPVENLDSAGKRDEMLLHLRVANDVSFNARVSCCSFIFPPRKPLFFFSLFNFRFPL